MYHVTICHRTTHILGDFYTVTQLALSPILMHALVATASTSRSRSTPPTLPFRWLQVSSQDVPGRVDNGLDQPWRDPDATAWTRESSSTDNTDSRQRRTSYTFQPDKRGQDHESQISDPLRAYICQEGCRTHKNERRMRVSDQCLPSTHVSPNLVWAHWHRSCPHAPWVPCFQLLARAAAKDSSCSTIRDEHWHGQANRIPLP